MAAGLLVSVLSIPAQAAPQIIAVLPSDAGVPFVCSDGRCTAELSSYCLQRERAIPRRGTPYKAAALSDFQLVIRAQGRERVIGATPALEFVSSRDFMAVTAMIDEKHLLDLFGGAKMEVALRISPAAALLPEPVRYDPEPLSEKEIAYVTQWRRKQGAEIVDAAPRARTVRTLAQFVNRLPTTGIPDTSVVAHAWERAVKDEFGQSDGAPALKQARAELRHCETAASRHSYGGLRWCMQYRHDDLIRDLNIEYWNSKPGS